MALKPDEVLNPGDVVAVHGIVQTVSPPGGAKVGPTAYKVRLPGIEPVYLTSYQIAGVVSRRLERGDLVRVISPKHFGKTARVLATDETFAFLHTVGEEPYGVLLSDVKVLARATAEERECLSDR